MIQISFIIPVYNVEKYVRECVLSVLELNQLTFEMILVDDGSVDGSMETISDLINNDSRIVAIRQENSGQSVARNKALQIAKGKYVFFLDSDDKIIASVVEQVFSHIKGDEDIIVGDFYKWGGQGTKPVQEPSLLDHPTWLTGKQFLQRFYLKNFEMVIGRNIYKTSFLKKHHFSFLEGVYYEDADWTPRCFALANGVLYINHAFYLYRNSREGSTMNSTFNIRKYNDLFTVSQSINNFALSIKDKEVANVIKINVGNLLLTAMKHAKLSQLDVDYKPLLDCYKKIRFPVSNNKMMQYALLISKKLFFSILMRRSF